MQSTSQCFFVAAAVWVEIVYISFVEGKFLPQNAVYTELDPSTNNLKKKLF